MLRDGIDWILGRPRLIAAIIVGGVLGFLLVGRLFSDDTVAQSARGRTASLRPLPALASAVPGPSRAATNPMDARQRAAVRRAIKAARRSVADVGQADIAIMLDDWAEPVSRSSGRRFRAWSVSKVFAAVALLRFGPPSRSTLEKLEGTITRSENCKERSIVLQLQRRAGSDRAASSKVRDVLADAHATAILPESAAPPEGGCEDKLSTAEAQSPALQLGVSEWSIADAALFMHALRAGVYGSPGSRVLALMGEPKALSQEVPVTEQAANPNWGIGSVFERAAYKSGWGGQLNNEYVAEQAGAVELPDGRWAALAVAFHPEAQPYSANPDVAAVPAAFKKMLTRLKPTLEQLG